jgi:Flp pilus assembly protein TadB
MVIGRLLAGATAGAGLLLLLRGWWAPPAPLDRQLVELYQPRLDSSAEMWRSRWRRFALQALQFGRTDLVALRRDLAICDQTVERHAVAKLSMAVVGGCLPAGLALTWALTGVPVPVGGLAVGSAVVGTAGFVFPDIALRRQAGGRRREFRYTLGTFLDLVAITLAGGGGVETAVSDAAASGSGWAFAHLQNAVAGATLHHDSPWASLERLADRLGSDELAELAAAVSLAGREGARVRSTLAAKAASYREHELSEAEAEAQAASERMGGPVVLMFVGLILLIGYPAMATVLAL